MPSNFLPNPEEMVYICLPHIYLEWFKIKRPKHPLASINPIYLFIKYIKSIKGITTAGNVWYDLLKYIFITVKSIRSSSYDNVFSRIY